MKKKIFKFLSVFLAWCMCMPVWGTAALTSLNAVNDLKSMSANIYAINDGVNASVAYAKNTAWMRWNTFSMNDGTKLQFVNHTGGGRMYFIVDGGTASSLNGGIDAGSNSGFFLINPAGIAVGANASFNYNGSVNAMYGLAVGSVVGDTGYKIFREDGTITAAGGIPQINTTSLKRDSAELSFTDSKAQLLSKTGTSLFLAAQNISLGGGLNVTGDGTPDIVLASGQSVPLGSLNVSGLNPSDLGDLADLSVSFGSGGAIGDDVLPNVTLVASGSISLSDGSYSSDKYSTIKGSSIAVRAGGKDGANGDVTLSGRLKLWSDRIAISADQGSITLGEGVTFDGKNTTATAQLTAGGSVTLEGTKVGSTTRFATLTVRAGDGLALDGGSGTDSSLVFNTASLDAVAGGDITLSGNIVKKTAENGRFALTAGGTIAESSDGALKFEAKGGARDTVVLAAGDAGDDGYAIRLDGVGNDGLFAQVLELSAVDSVGTEARNVLLSSSGTYHTDGVFQSSSVGGVLELVSKGKTSSVKVNRASFNRLDGISVETAGGAITISDDTADSVERNVGIHGLTSQGGAITVSARNVYTVQDATIDASVDSNVGNVSLTARNLTLADGTTVKGGNVTMGSSAQDSALRIGDGVNVHAAQDLTLTAGNIDIGSRAGDATTLAAEKALTVEQTGAHVAASGENVMGDHLYVEENVKLVSSLSGGDAGGVTLNYGGELWLFGQAMNQGASPQKAKVEKSSASAQLKAMSLDMVGEDLNLTDDGIWSDVHWIGYYNVGANVNVSGDIALTPTTGTGLPTDDRASYIRGRNHMTVTVEGGKTFSSDGGLTLTAVGNLKLAGAGTISVGDAVLSLSGSTVDQSAGVLKAGTVKLLDDAANGIVRLGQSGTLQADALAGVGQYVAIKAIANADADNFTIAGDVTAQELGLDVGNRNVVTARILDEDTELMRDARTTVGSLSVKAGDEKSVRLTTAGSFNFAKADASSEPSLQAKEAVLTVENGGEAVHEVKIGGGTLSTLDLVTKAKDVSLDVRNTSDALTLTRNGGAATETMSVGALAVKQTGNLTVGQKLVVPGAVSLEADGVLELAKQAGVAAVNEVEGPVSLASAGDIVFRNQGDLEIASLSEKGEGEHTVTLESTQGKIVIDEGALNLNGTLALTANKADADETAIAIARQNAYSAGDRTGWNGVLGAVSAGGNVGVETSGNLKLAGAMNVVGKGNVTLRAASDVTQDAEAKVTANGTLDVQGKTVAMNAANRVMKLTGGANGGDFAATLAGAAEIGAVSAGSSKALSLESTDTLTLNGQLTAGNVTLTGKKVVLASDADFNVKKETKFVTGEDFSMALEDQSESGRTLSFGQISVVANEGAGQVSVTDARDGETLTVGEVKGSDVTLESTDGRVEVAGSVKAEGTFTVRSANGLTLNDVTAETISDIKIAQGDVLLNGRVEATDGGLVVSAANGTLTLAEETGGAAGAALVAKNDVSLSGSGGVNVAEGSSVTSSGGSVSVSSSKESVSVAGNIAARDHVTLTASGDVTQDTTSTITGGGKVKVESKKGNATLGGEVNAGTSFDVSVGEDLALGSVTVSEGELNLAADGNITAQKLEATKKSVKVKAGQALTVAEIVAGQDVNVKADTVTINSKSTQVGVSAGNDATLIAGDTLNLGGNVKAERDVVLQAENGISQSANRSVQGGRDVTVSVDEQGAAVSMAGSVKAGDTLKVTADSELKLGVFGADELVELTVINGDLDLSGYDSTFSGKLLATAKKGGLKTGQLQAADVSLTAGRELAVEGTVTAKAGNVALNGETITIANNVTVEALEDVTLIASESVNQSSFAEIIAGDDLTITAGSGMNLEKFTVGNDATFTVKYGDVDIGKFYEGGTINGKLTAQALTGNLTAGAATAEEIVLMAGKTLQLSGNVTASKGDVVLIGTERISQDGNKTVSAAKSVVVQTQNDDAAVLLSGKVVSGEDFEVTVGEELEIGELTVGRNAALTVLRGDLQLSEYISEINGELKATAERGNISVGALKASAVTLTAGQKLTLNGNVTASAGNVALFGKNGVEQTYNTTVTATKGTEATAHGDVTVKTLGEKAEINLAGSVVADGKINLVGNSNVTVKNLSGKSDVTVESSAGALALNGVVKSEKDVVLTAVSGIAQSSVSTVSAGNDVTVSASGKGSSVVLEGEVTAERNLDITAGKEMQISDLGAGNDATLNVLYGDMDLSSLIGDITVNGTFKATAARGALTVADVTAAEAELTAGKKLEVDGNVTTQKGDATLSGSSVAVYGAITADEGAVGVTATASDSTEVDLVIEDAVTAKKSVTLTAKKGNVTVGGVVTSREGDVKLEAGQALTVNGGVSAAEDAVLTAVSGVALKKGVTLSAGHDVTVTASAEDSSVSLGGAVSAGNDFAVTADSEMKLGAFSVGRDTSLTVLKGDMDLSELIGDVEIVGKLTAQAEKGTLKAGALRAGEVNLMAGQTLAVDGDVTATAGDATLEGASVTVDGAVTADKGAVGVTASTEALEIGGAVTAQKSVVLTAKKGDVTVGGNVAGRSVELTTSAELTLDGDVTATAGDVLLTGKAGIEQNGGTVQAARNVTVLAKGDGAGVALKGKVEAGQAVAVAAAGDLSAADVKGDVVTVTAGGNATVAKVEAGTLTATAASELTIASDVQTTGNATLNGGSVAVNGAVTAGGAVTAAAKTGDLTVEGGVGAEGLVALTAKKGDVTVGGAIRSGQGNVTVNAGAAASIGGNVTARAGSLTATANAGDLQFDGVVTVAGTTVLTATDGDVRAANAANDFGGKVMVTAGGDIKLANRTDKTLTVGNLTAGEEAAVSITTGSLKSDGTIALTGEKLEIAAADTVDLALRTGRTVNSLKANAATITAGNGALDIVSSEVAEMNLSASGGVTVQDNVGDLNLSAAASAGAVEVTTSGDLDVSALTAGKAVTLNATGSDADIRAENAVRIGGNAALTADGDIVMDNAANHIVGTVTALSTGGDVSLANDRALKVDRLQAGTAYLSAKGDVTVANGSVDKVTALAQGGLFDFANDRDLTLLSLAADAAKLSVAGDLVAPAVVDIASGVVALDVAGSAELHNKGSLYVTTEGVLDVNGISSENGDVTLAAAKIVQTQGSSVEDKDGIVDLSGLKAGVYARNGTVTLKAVKPTETSDGDGEGEADAEGDEDGEGGEVVDEGTAIAEAGFIGEAGRYVTVEAKTVNAGAEGELHLVRLGGDWTVGSSDGTIAYEKLLDLVVDGKIGSDSSFAFTGSDVTLTASGYVGINNLYMDAGGVLTVKRTAGSTAPQYPMFKTVAGSEIPSVTTWDPHNLVYPFINGVQDPMTPEYLNLQTMAGLMMPSECGRTGGAVLLTPKSVGLAHPFWVASDLGTVDLIGCGTIDLQLDKVVEVETKGDWPVEKKVKTHAKNLSPADTVFCGQTVSMK